MQQLALHYDTLLKGNFQLKKLNFLFVFQVNCPGCFLYGIPLVNQLFHEFQNDISFLGLSTAFEDFNHNTIENTRLLVEHNEIIGHTKNAFLKEEYDTYPFPVEFPIAMDKIMTTETDIENAITHICTINTNYKSFSKSNQLVFRAHVRSHLNTLDSIAMTFTLNQLKGTPSLLVFNNNYDILYHKFGHVHTQEIVSQLNSFVKTLS